ncbi:hypothetical protein CI109_101280 [Kwoniella shandongensis]|uniref:Uncharacterized protein n=1 Tax=Kwoniella shandongensis TaxID=1734106 RepID=A0A5M6BU57_9TREE|nr:uncharacterized protein CI109_005345 [Kwoniella shandongensis]KAA5526388.1 hypothetical protein CI109_005345 [Kwoniella shandongensis]
MSGRRQFESDSLSYSYGKHSAYDYGRRGAGSSKTRRRTSTRPPKEGKQLVEPYHYARLDENPEYQDYLDKKLPRVRDQLPTRRYPLTPEYSGRDHSTRHGSPSSYRTGSEKWSTSSEQVQSRKPYASIDSAFDASTATLAQVRSITKKIENLRVDTKFDKRRSSTHSLDEYIASSPTASSSKDSTHTSYFEHSPPTRKRSLTKIKDSLKRLSPVKDNSRRGSNPRLPSPISISDPQPIPYDTKVSWSPVDPDFTGAHNQAGSPSDSCAIDDHDWHGSSSSASPTSQGSAISPTYTMRSGHEWGHGPLDDVPEATDTEGETQPRPTVGYHKAHKRRTMSSTSRPSMHSIVSVPSPAMQTPISTRTIEDFCTTPKNVRRGSIASAETDFESSQDEQEPPMSPKSVRVPIYFSGESGRGHDSVFYAADRQGHGYAQAGSSHKAKQVDEATYQALTGDASEGYHLRGKSTASSAGTHDTRRGSISERRHIEPPSAIDTAYPSSWAGHRV